MHWLIRYTPNTDSVIPVSVWSNTKKLWGDYRKEMPENFNDAPYLGRVLIETKSSVLKRRFGSDLKSRKYRIQRKEIASKIIFASFTRVILFICIEGFYSAILRHCWIVEGDNNLNERYNYFSRLVFWIFADFAISANIASI